MEEIFKKKFGRVQFFEYLMKREKKEGIFKYYPNKKILLPEMRKIYPKANIKKITVGEVVGFDEKEGSEAVNLVCNLTGDNSRDVVSFGTEAGLFQEFGISTVVCGPGSIEQAHTVDEYITFDQLKLCLKMLLDLKDQISN